MSRKFVKYPSSYVAASSTPVYVNTVYSMISSLKKDGTLQFDKLFKGRKIIQIRYDGYDLETNKERMEADLPYVEANLPSNAKIVYHGESSPNADWPDPVYIIRVEVSDDGARPTTARISPDLDDVLPEHVAFFVELANLGALRTMSTNARMRSADFELADKVVEKIHHDDQCVVYRLPYIYHSSRSGMHAYNLDFVDLKFCGSDISVNHDSTTYKDGWRSGYNMSDPKKLANLLKRIYSN